MPIELPIPIELRHLLASAAVTLIAWIAKREHARLDEALRSIAALQIRVAVLESKQEETRDEKGR